MSPGWADRDLGLFSISVAAELAGYGVDTVVFEALPEVTDRPRATTVHARAVQSLVRRGRLPWLAPLHEPGEVVRPFRHAGLAGLTLRAPGTEPEPLLKVPQAVLEREFERQPRQAALAFGGATGSSAWIRALSGCWLRLRARTAWFAVPPRPWWGPTAGAVSSARWQVSSLMSGRRPSPACSAW